MYAIILAAIMQSQGREDFTLKIEIVNIPQIQRDLQRDWTTGIDPVDEDSRATYHVGEEMNRRSRRILGRCKITHKKDGDYAYYSINRIRYKVKRTIETPRAFEMMEWIISDHFKNIDIDIWEQKKKNIMMMWESVESSRRYAFIIDKQFEESIDVFDYYDDFYVYSDGKSKALEDLGYVPLPKPVIPPRPGFLKRPFFLD